LSNTFQKAPVRSITGIVSVVCGLVLILSVFLPWLIAAPAIAARFASSSGSALNISGVLALAGIAGGLLAIGFAFLPAKGARRILTVLLGIIVLGVLVLYLVNGTFPLVSSIRLGIAGIGVGCIIYAISGLALVITGLAIIPEKGLSKTPAAVPAAPKVHVANVNQAPRPAGVIPQPPANTCQACGAVVLAGSAFCRQCGAALYKTVDRSAVKPDALIYCSHCGAINAGGTNFCNSCGAAMAAPATPPKPAPPVYCTRCGAAASSGNAYCVRCGSPLSHRS
jgi:hypothetical protein